ncbi:MAG TPA: hypothetical protein VMU09_07225 [Acidimicrobiales bacterium]|nr:hypothetical protein [Acidimicrobiales bacterium]
MMSPVAAGSVEGMAGQPPSRSRRDLRREHRQRRLLLLAGIVALLGLLTAAALVVSGGTAHGASAPGSLGSTAVSSR